MATTTGSKYFINILSVLAEGQQQGLPWWDWVLIIIVVVLLLYFLWLWWKYNQKKKELLAKSAAPKFTSQPAETPMEAPKPVVTAAPVMEVPAPSVPVPPTSRAPDKLDDLTIIEGIGPKIVGVLQSAGIASFAQLAQADVGRLEQILNNAGLRLADPSTWAEQARLAGEGKWDDLKALQDSLKGGRRA